MDPKNRTNEKCNLPHDEILALKELVRLQRERVIVIKPCDKGAGVIILDFLVYMRSCYDHLLAVQPNTNVEGDEPKTCYKKEDEFSLDKAKRKIKAALDEGIEREIISRDDYKAMDPVDKNPSTDQLHHFVKKTKTNTNYM